MTLIREKRNLYLWITNIALIGTMFVSIIDTFFNQYYQILFLALYLVLFLMCYGLLVPLYYMVYSEGVFKRAEYAYMTFYGLDVINLIISVVFAALNTDSTYASYFMLAAMIFSILRLIYFNSLWKFNAK